MSTRHFVSAALLTLCLGSLSLETQATQYPLKVENCGYTVNFSKAPTSVVTVGQAGTEMLYALGLGDKVVGTAVWFNQVLPQFKEINAKVPRLADNDPSFESVVNKRPGLVVSQYEWQIGKEGVVGTREQFHDLKIPTYLMPSDCEGKNNLVGADGTRVSPYNIDALYKSVTQLAQIFDVEAQGKALVSNLKKRQADALKKIQGTHIKDISAAIWFSSAAMNVDPYMAGQQGVAGYMLKKLGLRNVVTSAEEWPTVGWETIAKANPTLLIIARMDRRRFPADDYKKKLEFLKNDPVTRHMDAVRHGRIAIVDANALDASIRVADGMETIADAILKIKGTH
ncbi:MAG: ABC transporter substrate-binding protein [Lautropia sp.]|nr:ABC transporter substrate-binding protein [Lautropia sp.]